MRDIKHKTEKPNGIVNNNVGMKMSTLFSFIVQLLFIDKLLF